MSNLGILGLALVITLCAMIIAINYAAFTIAEAIREAAKRRDEAA